MHAIVPGRELFSVLLPDGNYLATLPVDSLSDAAGNPLTAYFSLDFFSLGGDTNHGRNVNTLDFTALASHFNQTGTRSLAKSPSTSRGKTHEVL